MGLAGLRLRGDFCVRATLCKFVCRQYVDSRLYLVIVCYHTRMDFAVLLNRANRRNPGICAPSTGDFYSVVPGCGQKIANSGIL